MTCGIKSARLARTETRAWVCWTGRGSARLFVHLTGNASIRHTLIAGGAIGGRGRAHACKRSPGLQQQLPRGGALEFEAEFQVRVVVGATQEAEPRVQQARGDLCRATARFESSAQDWVATSLHRWVHNHTPTQALPTYVKTPVFTVSCRQLAEFELRDVLVKILCKCVVLR